MDIPANLERSLVVMLQLAFQKQFAPSAHRVENFLRLTYPKLNGFDYSIKTVAAALFALEQLDGSSDKSAKNTRETMVSLVAHLEYLLYHLNPAPSIQVHPFLSHWVETVIRLQNRLQKVTALLGKSGTDDAAVLTWLLVQKTRLEVIRRILADETDALMQETPHSLLQAARNRTPIDVRSHIQALHDTGVFDESTTKEELERNSRQILPGQLDKASGTSETGNSHLQQQPLGASTADRAPKFPVPPNQSASATTADTAGAPPKPSEATTQPKAAAKSPPLSSLLSSFKADPASTLNELYHLPLTVQSLETITAFLSSSLPPTYAISREDFARNYAQRCLRTLEQLSDHLRQRHRHRNSPFSPLRTSSPVAEASSASSSPSWTSATVVYGDDTYADGGAGIVGREEIARLVTLLLLFMRSLYRKGLVARASLDWELQELCVRYIWVEEVREFRKGFRPDLGVGEGAFGDEGEEGWVDVGGMEGG